MVDYNFKDVCERDIDMLIMEEFACSNTFSSIFLNKVNIQDAILTSVCH